MATEPGPAGPSRAARLGGPVPLRPGPPGAPALEGGGRTRQGGQRGCELRGTLAANGGGLERKRGRRRDYERCGITSPARDAPPWCYCRKSSRPGRKSQWLRRRPCPPRPLVPLCLGFAHRRRSPRGETAPTSSPSPARLACRSSTYRRCETGTPPRTRPRIAATPSLRTCLCRRAARSSFPSSGSAASRSRRTWSLRTRPSPSVPSISTTGRHGAGCGVPWGPGRRRQMSGLLDVFPGVGDPTEAHVLGGDFNTWVGGRREGAYQLAKRRFPLPEQPDKKPTHHFEIGGWLRHSDHLMFRLPPRVARRVRSPRHHLRVRSLPACGDPRAKTLTLR